MTKTDGLPPVPDIPQEEIAKKIFGKEGTFMKVERKLLEPAPPEWNFFSPPSEQKLMVLFDSIRDHGLLQPIVCRWLDPEHTKLQILSGHTREKVIGMLYEYTKDEKYLYINAMVYEYGDVTDEQAEDFVIDSNVANAHSELNPVDRAKGYYKKYLKFKKQSEYGDGEDVAKKVASHFNISRPTYFLYRNFRNLIPEFGEWLQQGKIGIALAGKLGRYSWELQKWLYDNYADKLTKKKLKNLTAKMSKSEIEAVLLAEDKIKISVPVEAKPEKGMVPMVLYVPHGTEDKFKHVFQEFVNKA